MPMLFHHRCRAAALLWALALGFVFTAPARSQSADVVAALRFNQSKWQAQRLTDYQFVFRRLCFCPVEITRPVVITVRDRKIHAVRYAERDQQPVPPEQFQHYLTIDDLFAAIQKAIEQRAEKIEVSYDRRRGFPTAVFIDQSTLMADEEQSFRAGTLKVGK